MKRHCFPLLVVALALALVATGAAGEEKKNPLDGTWAPVSITVNGKKLPEEELKGTMSVFKDGNITVHLKDGKQRQGTVKLDPAQKPAVIDVTWTEGQGKGTMTLGIYKVEGDTLTICHGEAGKPRPTAFESKPDSHTILRVLKKQP